MRSPLARRTGALVAAAAAALVPARAAAYRPFDGTNADVAELGSFELELGPAHWYYQSGPGQGHYLIAPSTVWNLGVLAGTELVFSFEDFVALGPLDGRPAFAVRGPSLVVKHVLREGSLQGKSGLSLAIEVGPLAPEIHGEDGFGASCNMLVSYKWAGGAIHFDELPSVTRRHDLDVFSGVIVEGPGEWVVRPVSEIFYEKDWGAFETESVLVGAIWTAGKSVALDVGLRGARIGPDRVVEARLGFTWAIPLWEPHSEPR